MIVFIIVLFFYLVVLSSELDRLFGPWLFTWNNKQSGGMCSFSSGIGKFRVTSHLVLTRSPLSSQRLRHLQRMAIGWQSMCHALRAECDAEKYAFICAIGSLQIESDEPPICVCIAISFVIVNTIWWAMIKLNRFLGAPDRYQLASNGFPSKRKHLQLDTRSLPAAPHSTHTHGYATVRHASQSNGQ